ncbi:MFS general substrate transporter [Cylindrobasidium torrendii FP15055 ss-10]|uniref:MFS general substrate transporter n=1 Tax=Cylindrobasidium torrendii FP15055 ss-10 TaxID=1314674 RepID=A0A0D7AY61_9AGAR|nr:MFS general substrate transporter [Cylindrobasidium torrendii FP15055 ss-10]
MSVPTDDTTVGAARTAWNALHKAWFSWGVRWRSSYWFVTFVVWIGVLTDLIVYSIIVPVIPFQLEKLGYTSVSSLTGWLMFTYSIGMAASTLFVSMMAESYQTRQMPLLVGNAVLIGSQVMFMEAPTFWVMCLARALQGIGSTMVWVVGLALICDVTPEAQLGRQLGLALSGLTIGTLLGPPLGGVLYARLGWHSPFVLGIILAGLDMIGRFLIIEDRRGSLPAVSVAEQETPEMSEVGRTPSRQSLASAPVFAPPPGFLRVLGTLFKSSRALSAGFVSVSYGTLAGIQDTILSVHLNGVWGLTSEKIGVVMLAAVIPTIFAPPITGWLSDRTGTAWIMFFGLIMMIPWCGAMIVEKSLGLFIASYALQSLFLSTIVSPLVSELAAVSRSIDGVGYAHVHGVFNFAFGVGSAVGPIIGGQLYDHVSKGFMACYVFLMGVFGVGAVLTFVYAGEEPLAFQLWHKGGISLTNKKDSERSPETASVNATQVA